MIHFKIEQVGEVLQRLYDSEIYVKFSATAREGFGFLVWDSNTTPFELNGSRSGPIEDVITSVAFSVAHNYPTSDFGVWYKFVNDLEDIKQDIVSNLESQIPETPFHLQ